VTRLANTILQLQIAATWSQCRKIFEQHKDVLLSDDAEAWLKYSIEVEERLRADAKTRGETTPDVPTAGIYYSLVRACRAEGIDAGFAQFANCPRQFGDLTEDEAQQLADATASRKALRELIEANTAERALDVIVDQSVFLYTPTTDDLLAAYVSEAIKSDSKDLLSRLRVAQVMLLRNRPR
jgi:hypothetical protein